MSLALLLILYYANIRPGSELCSLCLRLPNNEVLTVVEGFCRNRGIIE